MELSSNIINAIDNKELLIAVFLDLSKAFDTVEHNILLKKMDHYGIRGIINNWFKSYLNNRFLFVNYLGVKSELMSVPCSVAQGSILGPTLFSILVNDLGNVLEFCKCIMYADDTTIYLNGRTYLLTHAKIQKDIRSIAEWLKANKLSLNIEKTCYITFRSKTSKVKVDRHNLKIDGVTINRMTQTKLLGVVLDEHLTFKQHIEQLISKLKKSLSYVRLSKYITPSWIRRNIYYAHFYSHLTYALNSWGTLISKKLTTQLQTLQDKIITEVGFPSMDLSRTKTVFKLLNFDEIINSELCKLAYRYFYEEVPEPVLDFFEKPKNIVYNLRNKGIPTVKKHTSTLFNKSFLNKCMSAWRTLPLELRKEQTNYETFKSHLKKWVCV